MGLSFNNVILAISQFYILYILLLVRFRTRICYNKINIEVNRKYNFYQTFRRNVHEFIINISKLSVIISVQTDLGKL